MSIRENIENIQARIAAAAQKSGRRAEDITLVAVTKTVEPARILEAVGCGIRAVGENKAQELVAKYPEIRGKSAVHFIGHLQTNKVKSIIDKVDCIESVDSVRLAAEIDRQAGLLGRTVDVFLEINIGGEVSKYGFAPEEIQSAVQQLAQYSHIKICGLMSVLPKLDRGDEKIHTFFDRMYELFIDIWRKKQDNISMSFLSMGMTGDFEEAIAHGANLVRIGTGIFGGRPQIVGG